MYDYSQQRQALFTDEGQRKFLRVRSACLVLLEKAGAFRLQEAWDASNVTGDSWETLACFDRLEELGEIVKVHSGDATQYAIYRKGRVL